MSNAGKNLKKAVDVKVSAVKKNEGPKYLFVFSKGCYGRVGKRGKPSLGDKLRLGNQIYDGDKRAALKNGLLIIDLKKNKFYNGHKNSWFSLSRSRPVKIKEDVRMKRVVKVKMVKVKKEFVFNV